MNIYCFSTLSFAKLQFKSVINKAFHKHGVASFTDAWIETERQASVYLIRKSHLLQMRGLKLVHIKKGINIVTSHLLQMRGLKHPFEHGYKQNQYVASFTDAWIETGLIRITGCRHLSRIFYRCVD